MRVVAESLHELLEVLVQERVVRDLLRPRVELVLGRQLPVDEEVRRLQVRALLRELVDRLAAVAQDPGVAVDVRDAARDGRRVEERRVVARGPNSLSAVARIALSSIGTSMLLPDRLSVMVSVSVMR